MPEKQSSQSDKTWKQGNFKSSQLFNELGDIWKYEAKIPIFNLFYELGKIKKSS